MNNVRQSAAVIFVLDNDKFVLQRRTADAPYAPNALAFFGGGLEASETPLQAITREVGEETSINVAELEFSLLGDFVLKIKNDIYNYRHFHVFRCNVADASFEVYEGQCAEVITLEKLKHRNDLSPDLDYAIKNGYFVNQILTRF